MIREFSAHAKGSNGKARFLFTICAVIAFALVFLSMIIQVYRGIVCLIGMVFLITAITLYTKYLSVEYYYDITFDSEETPLFVVRQLIGKRQTTLCRIGLAEIVRIEREGVKERREHKTPAGFVKYSYLPTLMPEAAYRVITTSRYEKAEIVIEISEEFASLLRAYSLEAREMITDDE